MDGMQAPKSRKDQQNKKLVLKKNKQSWKHSGKTLKKGMKKF